MHIDTRSAPKAGSDHPSSSCTLAVRLECRHLLKLTLKNVRAWMIGQLGCTTWN